MASNLRPVYVYTVVYVKDVAKSVAFEADAFDYDVRRSDESNRWGELESGQTTIAFTPMQQHETDDLTGKVQAPRSGRERAVENGGVEVSKPEEREWGQKVGFVRDIDGIVVRIGSRVNPPNKD